MKDLYEILNLNKSSSDNDIKKAYKKLAFQYHPDKNKSSDAESKFREISEAYDILMNTDKRRMYDNFGYDSISGDIPQINPLDLFQSLKIIIELLLEIKNIFLKLIKVSKEIFSDLSP